MPRGSTGRRPVGKTGQMAPSDPVVDPISSRLDYDVGELRRAELAADPVAQLRRWLDDAGREEVPEPNAMAVATVDADGRPRVRNVLLRNLDEAGLVFYSNRLSAKGQAIDANPVASALFSWLGLQRQARVDADVEVIDGDLADTYWANRPQGSQIASAASPQGEVVADRAELEALVERYERDAEGLDIPRPEHWVGYRLVPHTFEFWQGRRARLHDRFRYRLTGGSWEIDRLAP